MGQSWLMSDYLLRLVLLDQSISCVLDAIVGAIKDGIQELKWLSQSMDCVGGRVEQLPCAPGTGSRWRLRGA